MRRFLVTALVAGSLGGLGLLAAPAYATSSCPTGPTVTPSGTGGTATVGTPLGCATASGDAASQSGYVVVDGSSSNPGPLAGYVGVDGSDGGPTVVGCSTGDYTPGAGTQYAPTGSAPGNNVIASEAHPPSAPSSSDPCTPTAP